MRREPALLGVDVGFAEKSLSTGIAWRVRGQVGAGRVGTSWASRGGALPKGVAFDVAALDAPIVPVGDGVPSRGCENVFCRGVFSWRCKPGMSHFGRGLELRNAGRDAAGQFLSALKRTAPHPLCAVPGFPSVEAFPNTFLGVLLPEDFYPERPTKRRRGGPKTSDLLYEAAAARGVFRQMLAELGWNDSETLVRIQDERDHDLRAAFVCLLTAGFAYAGTATVVGDSIGGWFWLPPRRLWASWASEELDTALARARLRGHPWVAVTPSAGRFAPAEPQQTSPQS